MNYKIYFLFIFLISLDYNRNIIAQENPFDALWKKVATDTTKVDLTKTLNTVEKEKINSVDLKDNTNKNINAKKIDTINIEKFSSNPVLKDNTTTTKPREVDVLLDNIKKNPAAKNELENNTIPNITSILNIPLSVVSGNQVLEIILTQDSIKDNSILINGYWVVIKKSPVSSTVLVGNNDNANSISLDPNSSNLNKGSIISPIFISQITRNIGDKGNFSIPIRITKLSKKTTYYIQFKDISNNVTYQKIAYTTNEFPSKNKDIATIPKPKQEEKIITKKEITIIPSTKLEEKIIPKKEKDIDDFSTQPVVKQLKKDIQNKNVEIKEKTHIEPTKPTYDLNKNLKEFTFETAPVVSKNNATYKRKDEPLPKTKEQIEDAIPVNKIVSNISSSKIKEPSIEYAQYDAEADKLHLNNKRVLDSVLKTLNIKVPTLISSTDYIDIFVNGGGILLDNTSKTMDRISIFHTGVMQREYKTNTEGVQRIEKKISRNDILKLAQYIIDLGYFDFNNEYPCENNNTNCTDRLNKVPQPFPLDITVTIGKQKKKIQLPIYAPKTEPNWTNYPANLEKILNAIYAVAEK